MSSPTETTAAEPQAAPPDHAVGPVRWLKDNLFSSTWNTLLTLVMTPLLAWVSFAFLRFLFVTARWEIVEVNLTNFMVGGFPRDQLSRLWLAMALMTAAIALGAGMTSATATEAAIAAGRDPSVGARERVQRAGPPLVLLLVLVVFVRTPTPMLLLAGVALAGAVAFRLGRAVPHRLRGRVNLAVIIGILLALWSISGFGGVPRGAWGGLLLTAYYTIGALLLAFPIGVVLALGRRSTLPVVRVGCSVFIEFFRGSPLIALLFVGWLILPFFLPAGFPTPDLVTRALTIFVLFTSAYVAEIVRGGLQSVPRGQREAAQALGLSPWRQTRLVILPQALRSVIPALVGQAISLYKDTTLVLIIGQIELLAVAQNVTSQERFVGQGYIAETLVFVSLIYWVGSYWMSRESQRLEARLGVGTR
jgi:general L-amino acid transport system permease protein